MRYTCGMTQEELACFLQDPDFLRQSLGSLEEAEVLAAQAVVRLVLAQVEQADLALVSRVPTPGLLMSMAIRHDHALGCPGYYDQPLFAGQQISHQQRLDAALREMKRLHEEVVGRGFYQSDREAAYVQLGQVKAAPEV